MNFKILFSKYLFMKKHFLEKYYIHEEKSKICSKEKKRKEFKEFIKIMDLFKVVLL